MFFEMACEVTLVEEARHVRSFADRTALQEQALDSLHPRLQLVGMRCDTHLMSKCSGQMGGAQARHPPQFGQRDVHAGIVRQKVARQRDRTMGARRPCGLARAGMSADQGGQEGRETHVPLQDRRRSLGRRVQGQELAQQQWVAQREFGEIRRGARGVRQFSSEGTSGSAAQVENLIAPADTTIFRVLDGMGLARADDGQASGWHRVPPAAMADSKRVTEVGAHVVLVVCVGRHGDS